MLHVTRWNHGSEKLCDLPKVTELEGLPWWLSGKESSCQYWRQEFNPWFGKIPWSRKWQPSPVFLPGKSHGWRSLAGYSPWGCKESDRTERLSTSVKYWPKSSFGFLVRCYGKIQMNFLAHISRQGHSMVQTVLVR